MEIKLEIILIISMIIFLIYIFYNIKKNKLSIKNSVPWIILVFGVIIAILNIETVKIIAFTFGVEKAINMIFFSGFIFVLVITFNLTKKISDLNVKILKLAQEYTILINKIQNNELTINEEKQEKIEKTEKEIKTKEKEKNVNEKRK